MDKLFKLQDRGTTVGTEIMAGITTFLTMVYIVIVNPGILSKTGMDFHGVFIATVLASIVATLIMGVFANYPIALAPGMGLNAYFAFTVVSPDDGVTWQIALGAVFVAGLIFILLSLAAFRYMLLNAIPPSLKHAITAGIGLFITFIGLQNAGIIVDSPSTLLTLGDLTRPMTALTMVGLFVSLILMAYRVRGYLFVGMLVTAVIALIMGQMDMPSNIVAMPSGLDHTAFQLDIGGVFRKGLYAVIFTFLLITLFDTTGTMLGVAEQAGLLKDGKFPRSQGALLADAIGTSAGALLGTSPTSAYIESSAGVAIGGRTGLTAVVVCVLLALTLFFSPVVAVLSGVPAITAPALIIVGFLMLDVMRRIEWNELEEAFPAFLIVVLMPLTYSIATGIGIGFIAYPLLKLLRGKAQDVHPVFYLFAVLFFIQIVFFTH
ncbi:NCS2 family permease [Paenibacillus sacheonensis]|uniref:NCS2 family permease n=1 Tax=Paenibacillus sacheonensis TaxID=742054 RepID=A0A7X4YQZ6_9BACL|nr:NCS2 family permease [Paenibacillus sacheonensis]MBM7567162.1 AGZA family xanthine/uracil permease-like MFS transporter [Paenibacillus sacheonensis]NBC70913.1 NCS2 family permease [Paenibacillus sacheonensis]